MTGERTIDEVCRGELVVEQPRSGYRFNLDAVLLARFAAGQVTRPPPMVVDLGAGCGVVGLLLAQAWPGSRLRLVELQPEMAELARRNAERNGLSSRVEVCCSDLRRAADWTADLAAGTVVVCNPPFFAVGQGRLNPDDRLAVARHEVRCTLEELVDAISVGLPAAGELVLVHLAKRREELIAALRLRGLGPLALRSVRPLPGRAPTRLLVVATRAGGALAGATPRELRPLVIGERPGRYSSEVRRMLNDPD